jgi:hypothetical protein
MVTTEMSMLLPVFTSMKEGSISPMSVMLLPVFTTLVLKEGSKNSRDQHA